jgi:hypothetical protein
MYYRFVKTECATWNNKSLLRRFAPAMLALLAMASFAHAAVIVSHTGSANPTSESPAWGAGGSGTFGPGGTDTKPYWDITTTSGGDSAGGNAYYSYTLNQSDVSGNWLAEATVKIPTLTSGAWGPSDAYLNVYVGTNWYFIGLSDTGLYQSTGSDGYTNQLYAFTPDTSTYYTMSMKETGAGVNVYLSGSLVASNITPRTGPNYGNLMYWGDGGSNSGMAGQSNWNSVVFNTNGTPTLPEPGTIVLACTGLLGLLCYAWRKRRS